ncbi:hypothetical protein HHL23_21670 [Chryseobacterium sp. RP-3-3]|uniref:Uncharacterized protein n=1 Tax=Chryseobacterium antibioticum TaxID=2728847 RepID=A0A7Y0FTJ3_9FLAO|nr:hypothetical protein [Chryseobacterium antibioticum]NML72373.1 hypothetical protein [Chryseobacterium antibioticum]
MDELFYKQKFQEAVDTISDKEFDDAGLRLFVHAILESVALKIYKPEWSSNAESFFRFGLMKKQSGKVDYITISMH